MNLGWWDHTPRTERQLLTARITSLRTQADSLMFSRLSRELAAKQLKAAERELRELAPEVAA